MKRDYMKPTMKVVGLRSKTCLLSGSPVQSISGNVFNSSPKAGAVNARSRSWDDGWDDEE